MLIINTKRPTRSTKVFNTASLLESNWATVMVLVLAIVCGFIIITLFNLKKLVRKLGFRDKQ